MRLVSIIFYIILLLMGPSLTPLEAKPPQLTPRSTRLKIEEILHAHAEQRTITGEIIGRMLSNFFEEIDPQKTLFLREEIEPWLSSTPQSLDLIRREIHKERFNAFFEAYNLMPRVLERAKRLEPLVEKAELRQGINAAALRKAEWCQSEEELLERLIQIRSLQRTAVSQLGEEEQNQFFQKLAKRKLKRETELFPADPKEQEQVALSYALKALCAALDSQTNYFTPSEASQFLMQVQQKLYGIGAQLRDDLNGFTIVHIVEGSPASLGGQLRMGDRIIAVNGEPVVGMEISDAVELIRGPEGTKVLLTILRTQGEEAIEEKIDVELARGEIVLKESRYDATQEPYGDGTIAILRLHSFYQDETTSSSQDLANALREIEKERMIKGVILDLRDNPGGLMSQGVSVGGLFLKKGVVVSVKDNSGQIQHMRNLDGKRSWDGPLIVLTSQASASASEIVAQTLKDYGRALIVGDPHTFGKGTFQTFTLESSHYSRVNPQGEFKVTRGKWYSVGGICPQLTGVQPHIVVVGAFSSLEIGEKFSKYPLQPDSISPSFRDSLSDLNWAQRAHLGSNYLTECQTVSTLYEPFIEQLKTNSAERIRQNSNYQAFISLLQKDAGQEETSKEEWDLFGQNDLQMEETIQIMKDLIFLLEKQEIRQRAA